MGTLQYLKTHIETTYPHIHKPILLGLLGAILGMRGREADMQYYKELREINASIVPSRLKFDSFIDTITNTTGFGNTDGYTQVIFKQLLINPNLKFS